ncbi:MAG: TolC family protein, partial [Tolumonas sp.]|nr:TolC family protein [Tolumonas sp.]
KAAEDVEDSFSTLVKREQQATMLAQGVDALSRARKASFSAYQKGTVSMIEVLQVDENLLEASDRQILAQAESANAAVAAFKALGGGWQADMKHP